MKSQIFLNLPVKDLAASEQLYLAMGFSKNPQFSDHTAACMVFSEEIFVMLLSHEKFNSFATKPIADTKNNLAGLFALSVENLQKVNQIADQALQAGATEPRPYTDYGFMQLRVVEDFDGHTWEIFCMDPSKMPQE